jgi:hypothetical protein
MPETLQKLAGTRIGTLTVLNYAELRGKLNFWKCRCDCGVVKFIRQSDLIYNKKPQSCGCLTKSIIGRKNSTHGATRGMRYGRRPSPEYVSWLSIKHRCFDPNHDSYQYYGACGITMCSEWIGSFEAFLAYIGPKPPGRFTIHRIDNNRGYEPGNVKWADDFEQQNNTSANVRLAFQGRTLTMAQWARELNIPQGTVTWRKLQGWSTEEILYKGRLKPSQIWRLT